MANIFKDVSEITRDNQNSKIMLDAFMFYWEFILLGLIITGVINTFTKNNIPLKIAARCNVLGSCLMLTTFGILTNKNIALSLLAKYLTQIGLALFYLGISLIIIELIIQLFLEFKKIILK